LLLVRCAGSGCAELLFAMDTVHLFCKINDFVLTAAKNPFEKKTMRPTIVRACALLGMLMCVGGANPTYAQTQDIIFDTTTTASTPITDDKRIVKQTNGAVLTLTGNNDNTYTGGTLLEGGTIVLGKDTALSTTATTGLAPQGWVTVSATDGTIAITEDRTIQNHFQLGDTPISPAPTLTFQIPSGITLTITGVTNAENPPRGNGGAINVLVPSANANDPRLKFTGGGKLVIQNNRASGDSAYGGGVSAYFGGANEHAVLDFTNLTSVFFSANTAGKDSSGYGGGVAATADSGDAVIKLGNNASFDKNIAAKDRHGGWWRCLCLLLHWHCFRGARGKDELYRQRRERKRHRLRGWNLCLFFRWRLHFCEVGK